MLTFVKRARARLMRNRLLWEGANSLSAALGAVILLLVAGAEVLDWRWALCIPVCAAAIGLWRAFRRRPTLYATAQLVDRRLGLADTLSTAWHFSRKGDASPELRRSVLARADRMAGSLDVRRAIPFTLPRTIYLTAALFLVASSLFALRYALLRTLDLKPSLAGVMQVNFAGPRAEEARNRMDDPKSRQSAGRDSKLAPENSGKNRDGLPEDGQASPEADRNAESGQSQSGQAGQNAETAQNGPPQQGGANREAQAGAQKDGGNDQAGAARQNASAGNQSLLDKFKDAVQNLFARSEPREGTQSQDPKSEGSRNSRDRQGGSARAPGAEAADGGRRQSQASAGDSQQASSANSGQAQSGSSGADQSPQDGKQAGSGIGNEDGNKEIRQAEQRAAMGKISEILGRRAANLTGEATVEAQSSSQQLVTPYARRQAAHAEGGAAIGRDEVPLALQPYVEHYFEQVRSPRKK